MANCHSLFPSSLTWSVNSWGWSETREPPRKLFSLSPQLTRAKRVPGPQETQERLHKRVFRSAWHIVGAPGTANSRDDQNAAVGLTKVTLSSLSLPVSAQGVAKPTLSPQRAASFGAHCSGRFRPQHLSPAQSGRPPTCLVPTRLGCPSSFLNTPLPLKVSKDPRSNGPGENLNSSARR